MNDDDCRNKRKLASIKMSDDGESSLVGWTDVKQRADFSRLNCVNINSRGKSIYSNRF